MRSTTRASVACATVAALALGACSSGSSSGTGGDDELVLWHMEGVPHRVAAIQELADEYNATNPDLPVRIQVQEWDQVYSKIAGAVQSGQQPDILFTIPDFTTYVRQLGVGQPVTELVDGVAEDQGLTDAALAPYRDEDEYWALPMFGMVQVLWYRADLLAEAGVEPPETWEELRAAAEALTTGDRSGIALPAGRNLATDQTLYSLLTTAGAGNFFTDDERVDIDSPETVAAFELYDELLEFSPNDSGSYSWGEPQAAFNNGSVAMAIEKGQYLGPFEEETGRPAGDLGCAPVPQPADGGQPGSIYISNGAMVLTDDDARAEGAGDFLTWLLAEEQHYADFLNAEPGLFLPVTEDGAESEAWRGHETLAAHSDCVDVMLEQAETGQMYGFVDGQYIDAVGEIAGQNFLAQAIQEMYVNGRTPAESVTWLQERMQEGLD